MNTQLSALKISAKTLLVIASLTLPLAASNAHAAVATLIHDYALNGTLADSIGSASLTSNGGTVGIDGYAFGPDQGPSLANAIDPFTYSIAMQFSLDATDGWRRLIDFKNRTSDNGLYNFGNKLQFVVVSGAEFVTGSTDVFAAGKTIDLVITRDGASKQFIGYIDGIPQITFTDTADGAVFDATPDHLIQFLRDDLVFSG